MESLTSNPKLENSETLKPLSQVWPVYNNMA